MLKPHSMGIATRIHTSSTPTFNHRLRPHTHDDVHDEFGPSTVPAGGFLQINPCHTLWPAQEHHALTGFLTHKAHKPHLSVPPSWHAHQVSDLCVPRMQIEQMSANLRVVYREREGQPDGPQAQQGAGHGMNMLVLPRSGQVVIFWGLPGALNGAHVARTAGGRWV